MRERERERERRRRELEWETCAEFLHTRFRLSIGGGGRSSSTVNYEQARAAYYVVTNRVGLTSLQSSVADVDDLTQGR